VKTDSADPVITNTPFTYTITITNIGEGPVGGQIDPGTGQIIPVELIDQLPPGYLISGFTVNFGGVCILSNPQELRCDFGQFLGGTEATVTITGRIVTSADTIVQNFALVDLPTSEVPEQNEVSNNIAQQSTTILGPTPTATPTRTATPTITPTPTITSTPTITPTPRLDTDGDTIPDADESIYGTNILNPDTDADGCADGEEIGPNEAFGGRRDPTNFWDYFDTPTATGTRDKDIDLFIDIFGVALRFGAEDAGGTAPINRNSNPLTVPPPVPAYHPAFDRSAAAPGGDAWDLQAADGTIDLFIDIFGVAGQFGHSCSGPP